MKFHECIAKAVDQGSLTQAEADLLRMEADVHAQQLAAEGVYSPEQAQRMGAAKALDFRRMVTKRGKYQKVLQHQINQRNIDNIIAHPEGVEKGLASLIVKDLHVDRGNTPWSNVDNRTAAIEAQAHSHAKDLMASLHTTHLGLKQDKQTLHAAVREMFGESTGNATASKAAKAWADTAEFLRQRFNRAGGFIPKRSDWGLPQGHDAKKVGKASMEEWIDFALPLLNREAMLTVDGRVMTDAELMAGLKEQYWSIKTEGLNEFEPGYRPGGKMANRHQEHRWMVFKDADSWLSYQEKFGEPQIYNLMIGHIRKMSTEIAMMEILGPNPKASWELLKQTASVKARTPIKTNLLDAYFRVASGEADQIAQGQANFAKAAGATRHIITAAKLGSAMLSAITDPIYGRTTRKFNGIPAIKMLNSTLSTLNPADQSHRELAAHLGVVMDGWAQQALAGSRYAGELDPSGKASKVSEVVLRASGLVTWTNAQRQAFGLDFYYHLGQQVGKSFDEIEPKFKSMLERYGITSDDWAVIKQAELETVGSSSYFRPQNIYNLGIDARRADDLVTKITEALHTEMDFATPTPDSRVRAMTTGGQQRGTVIGEGARFLTMYKSFALNQMATHLQRGDWKYKFWLGIQLTLLGAAALQLKEIAKGREPRDMASPGFWGAAVLQGGGAGIFGDFIQTVSGSNRYGHGFLATAAGPAGSMVDDVAKLTASAVGAGVDAYTGEETNFGRESLNVLKQYIPGNSLWYTRLLTERLLWDNLQQMVDEDAQDNWDTYEDKLETERNQGYWWSRGDDFPTF